MPQTSITFKQAEKMSGDTTGQGMLGFEQRLGHSVLGDLGAGAEQPFLRGEIDSVVRFVLPE